MDEEEKERKRATGAQMPATVKGDVGYEV